MPPVPVHNSSIHTHSVIASLSTKQYLKGIPQGLRQVVVVVVGGERFGLVHRCDCSEAYLPH